MTTVLLVLHLFVTLALIGVVLLQRSEGGGLGIGSSQGMGSFMGGRGTANLLTRGTAILAYRLLRAGADPGAAGPREFDARRRSILDAPAPASAPAAPAVPALPAVPNN